jgi:hypothetical protein
VKQEKCVFVTSLYIRTRLKYGACAILVYGKTQLTHSTESMAYQEITVKFKVWTFTSILHSGPQNLPTEVLGRLWAQAVAIVNSVRLAST